MKIKCCALKESFTAWIKYNDPSQCTHIFHWILLYSYSSRVQLTPRKPTQPTKSNKDKREARRRTTDFLGKLIAGNHQVKQHQHHFIRNHF